MDLLYFVILFVYFQKQLPTSNLLNDYNTKTKMKKSIPTNIDINSQFLAIPTNAIEIEKETNKNKIYDNTYSNPFFNKLLKLTNNKWPKIILFTISLYANGYFFKCIDYYICKTSIKIQQRYIPYLNKTISDGYQTYICSKCTQGKYYTKCQGKQNQCKIYIPKNRWIQLPGFNEPVRYCPNCISNTLNKGQTVSQCAECRIYHHKIFRVKCCNLYICLDCIDNYNCKQCKQQFLIGCMTCVNQKNAICFECQDNQQKQQTHKTIKERIPWCFPANE